MGCMLRKRVDANVWLPWRAGMMQWGNVHICLGKRLADRAAAAGAPTAEIAAAAAPEFEQAAGRFAEAARIKPDFVDGAASEANLEFERGKLAAGLVVPTPQCAPGPSASERVSSCAPLRGACMLTWGRAGPG